MAILSSSPSSAHSTHPTQHFYKRIGVARILSRGAHFSSKKVDDLFQSSPPKDGLKLVNKPPNLPVPAQQKCPKIDSCSASGVHFVSWGCTCKFSLYITPKFFFTAHCTPWLRLCTNVTHYPKPNSKPKRKSQPNEHFTYLRADPFCQHPCSPLRECLNQ